MIIATADERAQTATRDEHGQALAEDEITRILKTVQAAQFKKSEKLAVPEDTEFKPRSLVEIAFAAEKNRKQSEETVRQQQAKEGSLQAKSADAVSTSGDDEGFAVPDKETASPSEKKKGEGQQSNSSTLASEEVSEEEKQAERESEEASLQTRAEEDQAIRHAAEEDGYKRGFEAGLEAAKAAEPTAEEEALVKEKEQQRQAVLTQFHNAIAALASPQAVDSSALEAAINKAVIELASERAGQVISKNPEGLVARIRGLVENIKAAAHEVDIFMNPTDLASLENWLGESATPSGWKFTADTQLLCGDIRLRIGGIEVADQLSIPSERKLDTLKENSVEVANHIGDEELEEEGAGGLDEEGAGGLDEEVEKSSRAENATVPARPPYIPKASEEFEEGDNDLFEAPEKGSSNESGKE